jgi:tetratricopeptide (TPR) repeat protein
MRKSKFGIGIAAAAVVAAIGAGLTDGVKETAKNVAADAAGWTYSQIGELSPLPQADKSAALSIFVAQFDGDPGGSQTRHVVEALRRAFSGLETRHEVEIIELTRSLRRRKSGDVLRNFQATQEKGLGWLKESKADILIWGEVARVDQGLRIYFVLSEGSVRLSEGSVRLNEKNYGFSEAVELTKNFDQDLGLAIAARVAGLAEPARQPLAPIPKFLEPLYSRLKTIALQELISQTPAACLMYDSIGIVALRLGEEKKGEGEALLLEAMHTYERALKDDRCRTDKDLVALFHNNLGITLCEVGKWVAGNRLKDAEQHFRAALELRPRERVPLRWAATQANLGIFLYLQASFEKDPEKLLAKPERLEGAAASFRSVLEVYSREATPREWAGAQLNLGRIFNSLGLFRSNDSKPVEAIAAYEGAIVAYQAALEVFASHRMAPQAAVATGYKGISLSNLAEEREDAGLAQNAIETLEAAVRMSRESGMTDFAETFEEALEEARDVLADLKAKP